MVRSKTIAVIGVVLLVALAGCGGTGTDTPDNESDGLDETDTTVGGADDTETTTEADETETTTEEDGTTTTEEGTTTEENATGGGADGNESAASFTIDGESYEESSEGNGSVVRASEVNLPEGGFIVLYESRDGTIGNWLGNSSYIESGTQENVTIQVNDTLSEETDVIAIAHQDSDDNQQFGPADDAYMGSDGPVTQQVTIQAAGNETNTTTTTTTTESNSS